MPRSRLFSGIHLADFLPSVCFFRNPKDFSTYILSRPAIWYNDKEVLADEEAFSTGRGPEGCALEILATSPGEEQYRGDDPQRAGADATRPSPTRFR